MKLNIRSLFNIAGITLITVSMNACKQGDTGPAGPAGPAYVGKITGFISLFDQYGTRQLSNQAGISVKIMESGKTTQTDSNGKYELDSLSTGNYSLQISDAAGLYGQDQINQLELVSGTVNRDVKLSQKPSFSLASLNAVDTIIQGTSYVRLMGTMSASDTRARTVSIFVGNTNATSSAPPNYLLNISKTIPANVINFNQLIPTADFNGAGLTTGSTAYFAAYPAATNYTTTSSYEDLNNGRLVYNAIGSNAVTASALVP